MPVLFIYVFYRMYRDLSIFKKTINIIEKLFWFYYVIYVAMCTCSSYNIPMVQTLLSLNHTYHLLLEIFVIYPIYYPDYIWSFILSFIYQVLKLALDLFLDVCLLTLSPCKLVMFLIVVRLFFTYIFYHRYFRFFMDFFIKAFKKIIIIIIKILIFYALFYGFLQLFLVFDIDIVKMLMQLEKRIPVNHISFHPLFNYQKYIYLLVT